MNLLQNKRKREVFYPISAKCFPDLNTKFSFKFKNQLNPLSNPNKIFMFRESIKTNFNNNIFNYESGNSVENIFNLNMFDFNYFKNNRLRYFLMPSAFQFEKYMNLEEFKNNNFVQVSHNFDDNKNNLNEKNKIKIEHNLKKCGDENKNIIFNNEKNISNPFDNILANPNNSIINKKPTHFSIKKEVKLSKPIHVLTNIPNQFHSLNPSQNVTGIFTTKNISELNQKKTLDNQNNLNETSRPFQTFNAKYFIKNNKNGEKNKSSQAKIFHIEKIFNKTEYRDANEKETSSEDKNLKNRFKISLKKIKQIFKNSCLKIYLNDNDNINFSENKLNDEVFLSQMTQQVFEIIKSKKINSSRMNEILQVNDDDKYRKHYFMFTSEAKQFCLDLINIRKLSFDIVMKMCKVPRKSLRRWSHVGCNRKKGCGRKTRNPEMENKLVEWYREEIQGGANVSAKMIRDKAVEISGDKDFLASKGWLEKFKKKFGIRIATHKNKNFKKIINYKEKIDKINDDDENNNNKINLDIIEQKENYSEKKLSDNHSENNSGNDEGNFEEKNEGGNELNDNEKNEENDNNDENNDNGVNINIIKNNNLNENEKNDETNVKIMENNINLRRPIFLKTKIDKGNSKKFNVFKLNPIC